MFNIKYLFNICATDCPHHTKMTDSTWVAHS